ncbi:hypothetical protein SAMN04488055_5613 [Chitinophaga niabensis]|uniref:Uncharacterized protein n=2 Tax=Chitinophaga niabensis TaxID=536979 RepID=A0A1N6KDT3_9BACT|nr:hypothetical protein SAMN04488055_5613 [Chitinophaga niabensis]
MKVLRFFGSLFVKKDCCKVLIGLVLLTSLSAQAQHDHHMPAKKDTTMQHDHAAMMKQDEHAGHNMHTMTHAYSKNLPMNRNGSGTSWLPDNSPMYMYMAGKGNTSFMLHGNIFLRYTSTDFTAKGSRGATKLDAPNWLMGMMNHQVGKKGLLNATVMLSFDRPIMGGEGYPLLFQSGETWQGKALVDRQHPHDMFAAISVGYTYAINKNMDVYGYIGYPGEPTISAPAFMHRVSAMNNPDAPLGHHWQDATHITFGVGTVGFRYKQVKAEFSSFAGREPDEDRYNFDKPLFDSYAYRVSYNPGKAWALQFSQAFVHSPEALEPDEDVTRTTASVIHTVPLHKQGSFIASSAVWGLNTRDHGHKEHSFLAESNLQLQKNAIYGRYEFVEKSTHELQLEDTFGEAKFNVHAFTLGYARTLATAWKTNLALGVQGTVNVEDKALYGIYGKNPLSAQIYLRISPAIHK